MDVNNSIVPCQIYYYTSSFRKKRLADYGFLERRLCHSHLCDIDRQFDSRMMETALYIFEGGR